MPDPSSINSNSVIVRQEKSEIIRSKTKVLKGKEPFVTESGALLPELEIAYTTHGKLNATRDNVIWVFHALTADADPLEWWPGLIGPNKWLDPSSFYIVCANVIGSCYGTTGPSSINPNTNKPYGQDFPLITIRDMVKAHQLLQQYLEIERIYLGIGGSLGGQQLLEWAVTDTYRFEKICLIATNARHSAWGIAFNETQRMALEAGGFKRSGLEIARAIAMLSYRHPHSYRKTQTDFDDKTDDFKASSYQRYQGIKLGNRFDPYSYYHLSKAMDSHNIGRSRKSVRHALRSIKAQALSIGLKTDLLFPYAEQLFISKNIKDSEFQLINSLYGHDGFLIETESIGKYLTKFLQ